MRHFDQIGKAFRVLEKSRYNYFAVYKCWCGSNFIARCLQVKSGQSAGCGCGMAHGLTKHGMHNTPTYSTWCAMVKRCNNPMASDYKWYGGRGIGVCSRWLIFENFLEDMGIRPEGMTLDRIDTNKDYCLENCRWATMKEQNNNRRNNKMLVFEERSFTLSELAEELGLPYSALQCRLDRGWSVEKAARTPLRKRG